MVGRAWRWNEYLAAAVYGRLTRVVHFFEMVAWELGRERAGCRLCCPVGGLPNSGGRAAYIHSGVSSDGFGMCIARLACIQD
jgi:hypothetical protein